MATAVDKHANEEHASHEEHTSLRTYFIIYIALLVLLVLTVWVAYRPWDQKIGGHDLRGLSVVVALIIASIKALLVVLFFMHVKQATRLTKIFVIAAFLWLGIMFILTFSDYLSRSWLPNSAGWVAVPRHQYPSPSPDPAIMPPEAAEAVHNR